MTARFVGAVMHPAFASIQLGPFLTDYHRRAVDARFVEALGAYLEGHLLPQVNEPFERTHGTLQAEVNEERFCGPHSVVRDVYRLEFSFVRPGGSDDVKAELRHDPQTQTFRLRRPHDRLVLWTAARKAAALAYRTAIEQIVSRIVDGEAGEWRCPRCEQVLRLVNTATLFDLSCPGGCFNYNFHRDPATHEMRSGHFFSQFFG